MKKRALYSFERGLQMTQFEHPRATYAINKNKRLVREIIEDMEKCIDPEEKMKEFFKEKEELAKKYCKRDEKGEPVLKKIPGNGSNNFQMVYDIPGHDDEKSKFRKELITLEKKYETDIKKHQDKVRKYNEEFLEEESEFKPFMIGLEFLEEYEKCPQNVMDLIFWMIDE